MIILILSSVAFHLYLDTVCLEDVLMFMTGAEEMPTDGYGCSVAPCVYFNDDQPYPTASMCSISLTLPTKYKSYNDFKHAMDTAMKCHGGFGLI